MSNKAEEKVRLDLLVEAAIVVDAWSAVGGDGLMLARVIAARLEAAEDRGRRDAGRQFLADLGHEREKRAGR